ncbi:DUF2945 domain-containing protein [Salinisphaera japonica]|uniref:Hypervirulence associated protein TUDOR domain-containing protein n=1 Tax=Salinisphaera japonica YTM-1 TaxID=1209778 RepID=A0A423PLY0_9GAMM|nr:DUF2945 domain-containing protein [Salinisphaera japonica]ROO26626.1 hypothetical protein SAJA_11200 [Salinisphaera japonica YTM-1]
MPGQILGANAALVRNGNRPYGGGEGSGKIVQIYTESVTKTLQGSEITRHGDDDNPAYLIEQDDGDRVLKLDSELK